MSICMLVTGSAVCREPGCPDEEPVLLAGIYRATMLLHNPGARPPPTGASSQPSQPTAQPRSFCLNNAASCHIREEQKCVHVVVHVVWRISSSSCVGRTSQCMEYLHSDFACAHAHSPSFLARRPQQ